MKRTPRLRHVLAAITAGWLLAAAFASPTLAEHPESAPLPFEVSDRGEDLCTLFYSEGLASWPAVHDPEVPSVQIEGAAKIVPPPPGQICLAVEPFPRQIKFIGHVQDWAAVEHVEPFDRPSTGPYPPTSFDYEFSLIAPGGAPIEYVTVAICTVPDEYNTEERCGETAVIYPGKG